MSYPIYTAYINAEASDEAEAAVRLYSKKLARFYPRINSLSAQIEKKLSESRYSIRLEVSLPGKKIVIEPDDHCGTNDVHIAIRDAFSSAICQLETWLAHKLGSADHKETS